MLRFLYETFGEILGYSMCVSNILDSFLLKIFVIISVDTVMGIGKFIITIISPGNFSTNSNAIKGFNLLQ